MPLTRGIFQALSDKIRILQCACTLDRTHLRHGENSACGMNEKNSKRRLTFVNKCGIMQSDKDKRFFISIKIERRKP